MNVFSLAGVMHPSSKFQPKPKEESNAHTHLTPPKREQSADVPEKPNSLELLRSWRGDRRDGKEKKKKNTP